MSSTNINTDDNNNNNDATNVDDNGGNNNNPAFDGTGKLSDHHHEKKEKLKCIVIDAITKECTATATSSTKHQHDDILAIAKGLKDGKKLELTILTGGLCNYSYKVHFANENSDNNENSDKKKKNDVVDEVALFAKLTFDEALLFPGTPMSQNRTQCEYEALELFANISPYPHSVCTPYFCIDVIDVDVIEDGEADEGEAEAESVAKEKKDNVMKLLVTQFAPSGLEEQCANKFIDGGVLDTKFASKLAKSLASLHNISNLDTNYDIDFNKEIKPFLNSLTNILDTIFDSYFDDDESCQKEDICLVTKLGKEIGKDRLKLILRNYRDTLNRTDCYVHGDCHVFNMLVEPTPSMESIIQTFQNDTDVENNNANNNTGDFTLIDWELSHVGPIGKDIGFFFPFPLACVFAHAINGDHDGSSKSILKFLDVLWTEYASNILLPPNSPGIDSINDIYYQVLGCCGVITLAYCSLGFHMEYLPIEEHRKDDLRKVKDALGIIGLKFLNIGFGTSKEDKEKLSLDDLKKKFNDIIQEEIDRIVPDHVPRPDKKPSRRSSVLRQSGRRVSDAHTWQSMAASLASAGDSNDEVDGGSAGVGGPRTSTSSNATARLSSSSLGSRRASIVQIEKLLIEIEDGY